MRCLVCGEAVEKGKGWEHLRSVHLEPLGVTQKDILEHAEKTAHPIKIRTSYITFINLRENIIYFSLENAEILIAFAKKHGNISWTEVVEWQILHEKGHVSCRELYNYPRSFKPYILLNVEDYYINKYLIPEEYWRVCIINARCSTAIRNITPLPNNLRDGYFYCTLATFLAYDAVTINDLNFLNPDEVRFVEIVSNCFKQLKNANDILSVNKNISTIFDQLFPQVRISRNS